MVCYTMEHRGGLDEALKTRKRITPQEFYFLLPSYKFYCYDERIFCYRYLLKYDDSVANNLPDWLLVKFKKIK